MTGMAVLNDEMWEQIEAVLPPVKGRRGQPMRDHRLLLEGAIFRYRTGVAWRDLPSEFGPWQTVWKRHHRFSTDGTWDKSSPRCRSRPNARGGIDWRVSVDSTSSRVHQHALLLRGRRAGPARTQGARSNDKDPGALPPDLGHGV